MTYKELAKLISELPDEVQNNNVTVVLTYSGESLSVNMLGKIVENGDFSDVLDVGHPVLPINF